MKHLNAQIYMKFNNGKQVLIFFSLFIYGIFATWLTVETKATLTLIEIDPCTCLLKKFFAAARHRIKLPM